MLSYHAVPPFGRGTICKFNRNVSAMKRLAACDFEDLLQCAIPVFEDLLPEPHNSCILDLLFDLAVWHAYAKLELHTTDTLTFFDTATLTLAHSVQQFIKVMCDTFDTQDLPQETTTHGSLMTPSSHGEVKETSTSHLAVKQRLLNLQTYKYHALGDYPNMICCFGTTDNYTMQTVSLMYNSKVSSLTVFFYRESYSINESNNDTHEHQKPRTPWWHR
ncbi:hypothetical protein F5141DRAFT_994895 [Pisolithus sp. B1]|nr:hypothetical protein F5141DRAFT_994895 [Pisolithus sp. B1]